MEALIRHAPLWEEFNMDEKHLAAGWRELSLAVSERLARPVGVGKVRWAVESSGLRIGRKIGNALVFDDSDVEATVRLLGGAR